MASEQGHTAFACGCHIARARGATSCLDRFGKEQFRRWHNETYGVTADGSAAKHLDPATSIHRMMWALKEPLADPGEKGLDAYGRKWQIKNWKLDGHEVCCHMTRMPTHVAQLMLLTTPNYLYSRFAARDGCSPLAGRKRCIARSSPACFVVTGQETPQQRF